MLDSTVVVAVSALPLPSTIVNWLVPCSTRLGSMPSGTGPRLPAAAVPMLVVKLISAARLRRYGLFSSVSPGAAGQRHEVGVGDVLVAVGVGEPLRLGDEVDAEHGRLAALDVDRRRLVEPEVVVLEDAERRSDGDAARCRRRHAAHPVGAVGRADRRAHLGLIGGQVGEGRLARRDRRAVDRARHVDLGDDVLRDLAGVIASAPPFASAVSDCAYAGFFSTVPSAFGVPSALKKYAVASGSRFRLVAFDAKLRAQPLLRSNQAPAQRAKPTT